MAVTMHLPSPMDIFPPPSLMAMSSRSHSRSSNSTTASVERERLAPPVSGAFYHHNYNYTLQSQRAPSPTCPTFDIRSIESLLRTTAPQAPPLQHIERLATSPHRVYLLRLASTAAAPLLLKTAPAPSTRMLRREATALAAEAAVLPLLAVAGLPVPTLISSNATTSSRAITNDTSASVSAFNTATTPQYLLRTHLAGTPLSYLSHSLPRHALSSINHNLGTYLRCANTLSSSSFGPASAVASGRGSSSWSVAFASMLEAALRDGEDGLVALPYAAVRGAVGEVARKGALDEVRRPGLVVGMTGREDVLVYEDSRRGWVVSGLLGWGGSVWGDVLMGFGPVVGEGNGEAEEAFWNGLGASKPRKGESAYMRLLLYSVYHAVVTIVARHYRPQQEDEEEEMAELAARRALGKALGELATL